MTTEASLTLIGGAPPPDARRVQAIRDAVDQQEPDFATTYGERARLDVLALIERLLAEVRTGDLGECSVLLSHLRDRVAALDPRRLEPPQSVAGWFSGRRGRLKQFRKDFQDAVRGASDTARDIVDLGAGIDRRGAALETLWSEARATISELDAYIAAAAARLAEPAAPEPALASAPDHAEPLAPPEDAPAQGGQTLDAAVQHPAPLPAPPPAGEGEVEGAPASVSVAEHAPESTPMADPDGSADTASAGGDLPAHAGAGVPGPEALAARLAALIAVRNTAVRQLPLVRLAQNADCRLPDRLKSVGETVTVWREAWSDALGLNSKRPRKVRPDPVGLARDRERLTDLIETAKRDISAALARRTEAETRMEGVAETVRRAA